MADVVCTAIAAMDEGQIALVIEAVRRRRQHLARPTAVQMARETFDAHLADTHIAFRPECVEHTGTKQVVYRDRTNNVFIVVHTQCGVRGCEVLHKGQRLSPCSTDGMSPRGSPRGTSSGPSTPR